MKKKFPFWLKIRFIFYCLASFKGTGTIVTCGKCNGSRVTFQDGKQEGNVYTSKYRCEDCGSTAECIETWDIN